MYVESNSVGKLDALTAGRCMFSIIELGATKYKEEIGEIVL